MTIVWQVAVVLLFVFNIALAIVVLGILRRAVHFLESQSPQVPADSAHDHEGFQRLGEHLPLVDNTEHGFAQVARTFPTTIDPDRAIFAALGVTQSPRALVISPDFE